MGNPEIKGRPSPVELPRPDRTSTIRAIGATAIKGASR